MTDEDTFTSLFTDEDVMLINFRRHYINKCQEKGISLFEAGRNFAVMQNMFVNPFNVINGKWDLCKEAEVLLGILDLNGCEDLVELRKQLKESYKQLGLVKFTVTNCLTGKSVNKYYRDSDLSCEELL